MPRPRSMRMAVLKDVRPLEPVREHQRLVGQEVARRSFGHDLATIEDDRARAQLDDQLEIVGGHYRGGRDLLQERLDLSAPARPTLASAWFTTR